MGGSAGCLKSQVTMIEYTSGFGDGRNSPEMMKPHHIHVGWGRLEQESWFEGQR